MYTIPFLLRVLGLLGLLLGLLGLLSVCSLKAQLHFATNSGRPNFARLCAFRLVNLAEGLLVCAAGEVNFAVCVRQARSHLCLLVVVHCKVVSTLDKRNTKSHLIKIKSRQEGLLAIIHDKRREHHLAAAVAISKKAASNYLYIKQFLVISVVLLACAPLF